MPDPTPRYLIAPQGVDLSTLRKCLQASGRLREVPSPEVLLSGGEGGRALEPGWVFVPSEVDSGIVHELVSRLGRESGAWALLLVDHDGDGFSVVPVSPGFREGWGSTLERMEEGGTARALLSFRHSLEEVSRIRHDVNNPLTSALAETQLMLMEPESDPEREEALRVVETQLRRIRDLIGELTALRAPSP